MSRGFLLDTNILSEMLRPFPDAKVLAWLDSLSKDIQFVSVVTLVNCGAARPFFRRAASA
jgi:predicted nucleic acid-binding protein